MAGNLGVVNGLRKGGSETENEDGEVVLIGDATAAWRKGVGEEWLDEEVLHRAHLESLAEFASVRRTAEVLGEWKAWGAGI